MLKVPFVKNPNGQCMQANMLMALRYFFPDKKFSFAQINKKMRRKREKWTFPAQAAVVLRDFGLKTTAYSSKDIPIKREKIITCFKRAFGKDYNTVIKNIDLDTVEYFRKRAKKERAFEVRKSSMKDFKEYLKKGYIIVPCLDSNILHNKKGPFEGHFVTVVNMDKNNVWIHDPNDGPDIRHSSELFNKAYTIRAIDDDVLIVFGKLRSNPKV